MKWQSCVMMTTLRLDDIDFYYMSMNCCEVSSIKLCITLIIDI